MCQKGNGEMDDENKMNLGLSEPGHRLKSSKPPHKISPVPGPTQRSVS
jgi:hypothetical protein